MLFNLYMVYTLSDQDGVPDPVEAALLTAASAAAGGGAAAAPLHHDLLIQLERIIVLALTT